MKIVRYETPSGAAWGVLEDGLVRAATGTPFVDLVPGTEVASNVRLLAPVTPRTVLCVGRNYRSHAEECDAHLLGLWRTARHAQDDRTGPRR